MQYRKNEPEKTRFRAKRIFNVGKEFYFNTREGETVGPFPNAEATERGVSLYLQCIKREGVTGQYATKVAMYGLWTSTNYAR